MIFAGILPAFHLTLFHMFSCLVNKVLSPPRAPVPLTTAVQVKDKADQIPVFLPLCNKLSDAVKKAQSWLDKVRSKYDLISMN